MVFWVNDFFNYIARAKLSDGSEVTVLIDRGTTGLTNMEPGM